MTMVDTVKTTVTDGVARLTLCRPREMNSFDGDTARAITEAVEAFGADDSVRVRFLGLGAFSLNVGVFAHVFCREWNDFLKIQEDLLLRVLDIVERTGAEIAIPSQTMYVAPDSRDTLTQMVASKNGSSGADALHNKKRGYSSLE